MVMVKLVIGRVALWTIVIMVLFTTIGRGEKPRIGESCPGFKLDPVLYYKDRTLSLEDAKGKWLVLAFWAPTNNASMLMIPRLESMQERFAEKFLIIPVAIEFRRGTRRMKIECDGVHDDTWLIPFAIDSTLYKEWDVLDVPEVYIIDPGGVLRFITDGSDLNSLALEKMLKRESVHLATGSPEPSKFTLDKIAPVEGVFAGSSLAYATREKPDEGSPLDCLDRVSSQHKAMEWSVSAQPLTTLYMYAYFGRIRWTMSDTAFYGKYWNEVLVEANNKSQFNYDLSGNWPKNAFNYAIASRGGLTGEMVSTDLKRMLDGAFRYAVTIEVREMPVMQLIVGDKQKMRVAKTGTKGVITETNGTVKIQNCAVNELVRIIIAHRPSGVSEPIVDKTGIHQGMNMTLKDWTTLAGLKRALAKAGLDLIPGKQEMSVLIIRDPK